MLAATSLFFRFFFVAMPGRALRAAARIIRCLLMITLVMLPHYCFFAAVVCLRPPMARCRTPVSVVSQRTDGRHIR